MPDCPGLVAGSAIVPDERARPDRGRINPVRTIEFLARPLATHCGVSYGGRSDIMGEWEDRLSPSSVNGLRTRSVLHTLLPATPGCLQAGFQ